MRTRVLTAVLAATMLGILGTTAPVFAGDTAAPAAEAAAAPAPSPDAPWPWAGDPRPYEASPYAKNIDQALRFMLLDSNPNRWMNLTILDYLQRKFGLHARYGINSMYSPANQPEIETSNVAPFGRLASPNHQFDPGPVPAGDLTFDKFMLFSLYSDRHPVPADFVTRLRKALTDSLAKGKTADYAVTHLALSFQWLAENNTAWQLEGSKGLRSECANALAEVVTRNGPDMDVSMEAIAFLQYTGSRALVKREWLDAIAAAQRPDGGWGYVSGKGESHGHPTVLALWALLEDALPDVPAVTWVQRTPDEVKGLAAAPAETAPAAPAEPAEPAPADAAKQ